MILGIVFMVFGGLLILVCALAWIAQSAGTITFSPPSHPDRVISFSADATSNWAPFALLFIGIALCGLGFLLMSRKGRNDPGDI